MNTMGNHQSQNVHHHIVFQQSYIYPVNYRLCYTLIHVLTTSAVDISKHCLQEHQEVFLTLSSLSILETEADDSF